MMHPDYCPTCNPPPIVCTATHGAACHQHPHGEACPVLQRWYVPPRIGSRTSGIAGVIWSAPDRTLRHLLFAVDHGDLLARPEQRDIPIGVYLCLRDHVRQAVASQEE